MAEPSTSFRFPKTPSAVRPAGRGARIGHGRSSACRRPRVQPIPWIGVASKDDNFTVASTDVDEALAAPTVIDAEGFDREAADAKWREFCLNADEYVAATTRSRPRQTA